MLTEETFSTVYEDPALAGKQGFLRSLPLMAARAVTVLEHMEKMVRDGVTLSPETIAAFSRAEAKKDRWRTVALWIIAVTFIGILWAVRQL